MTFDVSGCGLQDCNSQAEENLRRDPDTPQSVSPKPLDHMKSSMALNAAQHKIANVLKNIIRFFFAIVFIHACMLTHVYVHVHLCSDTCMYVEARGQSWILSLEIAIHLS